MCDLVFIVVHDEEKSDVSISRLYLDGTGSCCLANTIMITDIRVAAYEILHLRSKEPPLDGKESLSLQTRREVEVTSIPTKGGQCNRGLRYREGETKLVPYRRLETTGVAAR